MSTELDQADVDQCGPSEQTWRSISGLDQSGPGANNESWLGDDPIRITPRIGELVLGWRLYYPHHERLSRDNPCPCFIHLTCSVCGEKMENPCIVPKTQSINVLGDCPLNVTEEPKIFCVCLIWLRWGCG